MMAGPGSSTSGGADLDVKDLSKSFGGMLALDRTNLRVEKGRLTALLGPSGCGKSTTLRIIAGFEYPDTGQVLIGGRDILSLPPNRRGLGMVFQDYSLFPHMTVEENVGFGLKIAGVAKADIGQRVREMLDLVRLKGHDQKFPRQLSGGQQQRVALARSLVTRPSLLLLDEPLGALDKNLRESMQFELRRIQRSLDITTVLVTHDQEEALTLADTVAVMNQGRVLQVGSPREVYEMPVNRFVSEFLGAANIFEGKVASCDDRLASVALGAANGSTLSVETDVAWGSGQSVMLGVRPEKLQITRSRPENGNAVSGQVMGHVFRGTSHAYEIAAERGGQLMQVFQQATSRHAHQVHGVGDTVWLGWLPEDSFIFAAGDNQ